MEKGIKDLLIDELHDLLNAENQIIQALPGVIEAVESADLRTAYEQHLKETKGQVARLEEIFKILHMDKKEKPCKAMKGLIAECDEVQKTYASKSPVRDAAFISKTQRIEHYEISAYGTLRTFAKELDLDDIAELLQKTLDEEVNADKKLTKIAEGGLLKAGVNHQANLSATS